MTSKLSLLSLTVFGLPALVSAITHGPIAGVLPALYAEKFGLDLALIGTVLLIARLFDAVTDPMIGYASDITQTRWGKRKPWMVAGMLIVTVCVYFLFVPAANVGIEYYLIFSILLYLGWTIQEIPYTSWIAEISRDSKERVRINSMRTLALFVGGFLFTISPLLVPTSGGNMDFEVLGRIALLAVLIVPLSTLLAVWRIPQGEVSHEGEPPRLRELWNSLKINRAFHYFLVAYFMIGLASGVGGTVGFLYMDSYLQIGNRYAEIYGPAFIVGPLMIPFWMFVLNKFGKYRVTAIGFTVWALIMPTPWFVAPGPDAFLPILIYTIAYSAFAPLLMVTMPTILADIIDYDELQTGKNRAGQFNAFLTLIGKTMAGVGGPLAFILIGLFGYQPGVENTNEAILGLKIVAILAAPVIIIPAVVLLWRFPINDRTQKENAELLRLKLEREAASAESVQPA